MIVKVIALLLFIVETLNITSYTYYRVKAAGKANFLIKRKIGRGGQMTYCIPGAQTNPREAFNFFEQITVKYPNLVPGGISYIRYNNYGFDPEQIAKQIIRDIERFEYEPYIISISIGDQIAQLVANKVPNVKIISINPATNADSLRFENLFILQVKLAFLNTLATLGGWFGQLKTVHTSTRAKQSISLYLDHLNCLTKSEIKVSTNATVGLIISHYDQLLENREVVLNFSYLNRDQVEIVDTGHANTATGGILYAEKLENLLPNFYPPISEDAN